MKTFAALFNLGDHTYSTAGRSYRMLQAFKFATSLILSSIDCYTKLMHEEIHLTYVCSSTSKHPFSIILSTFFGSSHVQDGTKLKTWIVSELYYDTNSSCFVLQTVLRLLVRKKACDG